METLNILGKNIRLNKRNVEMVWVKVTMNYLEIELYKNDCFFPDIL